MSMSTPLLLLVGAVPQFLGTVLMLRISYHISRAAKLRRAQLEGELEASEAKQARVVTFCYNSPHAVWKKQSYKDKY